MRKNYYIFVLTFLCLLCGQMGYGQDTYGEEEEDDSECSFTDNILIQENDCYDEYLLYTSYYYCATGVNIGEEDYTYYIDKECGTVDCNGDMGGNAYTSECGCIGGNTGIYECPEEELDCNGDPGGSAYYAYCGCIGGNTGVDDCPEEDETPPEEPQDPPCTITSCPAGYVLDSDNCECTPDCTNEIADKIKNVNEPVFKDIIDKFNNPNSPYKVNISNGPISGYGSMAQTQNTTVRGTYKIVTNENYTTETSLIATANILHEYIHAYFNTLWLDWKDYGNTHVYDNFPILKDFYMNHSYSGTSEDAHHEQIADSFISNIADALKELEPNLSDQYYKDIAWATLYNTPVYDTDLNEIEQKRIKAIRDSEVTNTEREGNQPKGKPCNK